MAYVVVIKQLGIEIYIRRFINPKDAGTEAALAISNYMRPDSGEEYSKLKAQIFSSQAVDFGSLSFVAGEGWNGDILMIRTDAIVFIEMMEESKIEERLEMRRRMEKEDADRRISRVDPLFRIPQKK